MEKAFRALSLSAVISAGSCIMAFADSTNYTVNASIPDGNPIGFASTKIFSAPGITEIGHMTVTLNIQGGFNGDYYVALMHDGGLAVLLNRVGVDLSNPFGYSDGGMNVTFDDLASNGDIHTYQLTLNPLGGALTDTWQPDGRNTSPFSVTTDSPRDTSLAIFNGTDPNGDWTLFVADLSSGEQGVLESWDLNISSVPEPSAPLILLLGGILVIWRVRFRR